MLKYILRRLLHLIPTVLGVIVITFVLFNLVGGSPGRMALGQKASPEQVDAFDEQRGFNKPVLFGSRIKTLALDDCDFSKNAGPFSSTTSTVSIASTSAGERSFLKCTAIPAPPLAFPLRKDSAYEWTAKWRNPNEPWKKTAALFVSGTGATNLTTLFADAKSEFHIAEIQLRRVVPNPFDSQLALYFRQLIHLDLEIGRAHV